MKKILLGLSFILLLVAGCANTMNTPTKKARDVLWQYFNNYNFIAKNFLALQLL